MKKLVYLALILAACSKADAGSKQQPTQLTVDEVVDRHLEALGGADTLRATRTMKYSGMEEMDGKKTRRTIYRSRPDKFRAEFMDGEKSVVKAWDGQAGFVEKEGKAEPIAAEHAAMMKQKAQFDDPLLDWQKKGHTVTLVGHTPEAYQIELKLATGEVEHRWLDASTFLETRRTMTYTHEGKSGTSTIAFGDYRKVGSQMVNHLVEWEKDGKKGRFVIDSVQFDSALDASLFARPQVAAQ